VSRLALRHDTSFALFPRTRALTLFELPTTATTTSLVRLRHLVWDCLAVMHRDCSADWVGVHQRRATRNRGYLSRLTHRVRSPNPDLIYAHNLVCIPTFSCESGRPILPSRWTLSFQESIALSPCKLSGPAWICFRDGGLLLSTRSAASRGVNEPRLEARVLTTQIHHTAHLLETSSRLHPVPTFPVS